MARGRAVQWEGVSFSYPGLPTMISEEERRYLYWLGSEVWSGEGEIVEMGPWLGGSTVCLALGMRASGRRTSMRLHAIDSFVWRRFMAERADLALAEGESFRPAFERNLQSCEDLLVTHEAFLPDELVRSDPLTSDLRDREVPPERILRWDRSEPIEILFVDGAKSWTGMVHLLRELAPSLVPERSLVVCQDYKNWDAYWVPLALELLADSFELVHVLERNTVSFRVLERISARRLDLLPDHAHLDPSTVLAALDQARARLRAEGDDLGAAIVGLQPVRFLGNSGRRREALGIFRRSERRWPPGGSTINLERARRWLEESSGEPIPPAPVYRARRRARRLRSGLPRLRARHR